MSWTKQWLKIPPLMKRGSLRGFDLVPDFVVFGAARNILPEIDALHIGVGIIEVQRFFFFWGKKSSGGGIRRSVVGDISDEFLGFGFDHVGQEVRSEIFIFAGGRDH